MEAHEKEAPPLKGEVSGKNTGKKILSRTLSGVGTIAAYVVGSGGAGLNRTITGETLLRDRVAGNIALAGEQELMNAAYAQNISVTVPANTRFYVVLQKAAVSTTTPVPTQIAERPAQSLAIPTAQETAGADGSKTRDQPHVSGIERHTAARGKTMIGPKKIQCQSLTFFQSNCVKICHR